jgi:hypothetical protein
MKELVTAFVFGEKGLMFVAKSGWTNPSLCAVGPGWSLMVNLAAEFVLNAQRKDIDAQIVGIGI